MEGKLNLSTGPLYVQCHNDHKVAKCNHCELNCIDPKCNGSECDAHGNCMCSRTQCLCLGRL
jgi:hypothetical protein